MQKVYAKKLKNNTFSFYEDDVYHLLKVLRIKLNQEIICIYEEKSYLCRISNLNPLLAEIIDENNIIINDYQITLFQAVIKPKPFETIVANACLLNVDKIFPVLFQRSQKQYINNCTRINKIIKNNASIANRIKFLSLEEPISFSNFLNRIKDYDLVIIPYENQDENYLKLDDLVSNQVAIVVGPEGGFANDEITALAKLNNVKFIRLTPTILKSEIASLYTISIVSNYLLLKDKKD